ncbi:MAG: hypothetical protein CMH54_06225 [Myxococcales bacterium]|nr:hypothetical protein [Myxococcales bacterium]
MWNRVGLWLLLLVSYGLFCSCGNSADGGPVDPIKVVSIDTEVEVTTVQAGDSVDVSCIGRDQAGRVLNVEGFSLQIEPNEGASTEDLKVTLTLAGTVDIACSLEATGLVDDTPVSVEVTPGPASKTVAFIEPAVTVVDEEAVVTCEVQDAYGNEVSGSSMVAQVQPDLDVTVAGMVVSSTRTGDYEVVCVPEGADVGAKDTAIWTVEPGVAVTLDGLTLDPDLEDLPEQLAYTLEDKITVHGYGEDSYGNFVSDVLVTVIGIEPALDHVIFGDDDNRVRFKEEGVVLLTAVLKDNPDETASIEITVDQSGPDIVIIEPERGLTMDGDPQVVVSGEVSDNLGEVEWVRINDSYVNIEKGGYFTTSIPLEYGINMIVVEAADPFLNESLVARSVAWSTKWYPMDPPSLATNGITDGMFLMFTQEALDDGDHDPSQINDFATIFEIMMESMDLNQFVGNPIGEFAGCSYSINNMQFADSAVSLTLIDGGVNMVITLYDLSLDMQNSGQWWCVPNETITLASVTIASDILISMPNGEIESSAENTDVSIENLSFSGPLLNLISGLITPFLETTFEFVISDQISNTIGELFAAMAFNQTFELPAISEGGTPNELQLETEVASIYFEPAFLQLTMNSTAYAVNSLRPHEVLGSIGYAGCGPSGQPSTPPENPLKIAMHDDMLNQLVFGAWDGGTLNLQIDSAGIGDIDVSQYGITDLVISTDFLMPIVFNSCTEKGDVVEIGDLYLDASMNLIGQEAHFGFWIQGEAPVQIVVTQNEEGENEIGFELLDLDPLYLEVVINEGPFEGNDEGIISLIKSTLLGEMLSSLTGGLGGFAIPSIDLSSVSPDIPEGTSINVNISDIFRENAYMILGGSLK